MRDVPEWIGANDDSQIPHRVKTRVADSANNCCQICGVRISSRGEIDHVIALKNWNSTDEEYHGNRESNLRLLCAPCHRLKSNRDVSEKSKIYQTKKRMGPLKREHKPRNQLSKKMDGTIARWNPQTGKYDLPYP